MKLIKTAKFIQRASTVHNNKYDYSDVKYIGTNIKIIIICPIHKNFNQTPHAHLQGQGCPCGKKLNKPFIKTTQQFINDANKKHNNLYNYNKSHYIGANKKILIICNKHGEFWQKASHHLNGSGCPICQRSKGEEEIENWLKENNILYETQKRFKNCKNILPLPFDFYLPSYNILIEYQGEQHFKPMGFGGNSKQKFQRTIKNDQIKILFCHEYNIKLLSISYLDNINIVMNATLCKKYL
jgi:CDGSH-type Zn-finger protein